MAAESKLNNSELQKVFLRLRDSLGADLALFCICAVADLPYDPQTEAGSWKEYAKSAPTKGADGKKLYFCDGATEIDAVLTRGMTREELWLRTWGEGDAKNPYSEKQYKRLDALFKSMTGQLDDLGALTKQQEDTARICAIWALQREEKSAKGDKESIDAAVKLDKLIRENLADCNMRSRDILPTQAQRPDGFVDALRNKYGLSAEMSKDEVLEAFYRWCRSRNYPQTVDAAEKALLAIVQTMQKNNDLPVSQELPEEMELEEFGFEFADSENEDEESAYDYLGLMRERGKT